MKLEKVIIFLKNLIRIGGVEENKLMNILNIYIKNTKIQITKKIWIT